MEYSRSPSRRTPDSHMEVPGPFGSSNHPLGMLSNFIPKLQNLSGMQHADMMDKIKTMKGGLRPADFEYSSQNFAGLHTANAIASTSHGSLQSIAEHNSENNGSASMGAQAQNLISAPTSHQQQQQQQPQQQSNGFSFTPPTVPLAKDGNVGSNSSTSSETSNSSQQNNNGWSFEEQFKQVRQLYELSDDPRRKEFLDDLFSFMQKRGTPINRLPIMAKSVLDLYELYNLVIARGGLVDVINKKLWQEIIKGLQLPSSITSAAFTLRTQYMKYLYPYECDQHHLSTPAELQAAIDGNRREGRRAGYNQFDAQMQSQALQAIKYENRPVTQAQQIQHMQQMQQLQQQIQQQQQQQQIAPLSLVTHAAAVAAGAAAGAMPGQMNGIAMNGAMPGMPQIPTDYNERMLEYIKMLQSQAKEMQDNPNPDAYSMEALEMHRLALWSMSMSNQSPPTSNTTTSPTNPEPQREALNLSDTPPLTISEPSASSVAAAAAAAAAAAVAVSASTATAGLHVKRERERSIGLDAADGNTPNGVHQPPTKQPRHVAVTSASTVTSPTSASVTGGFDGAALFHQQLPQHAAQLAQLQQQFNRNFLAMNGPNSVTGGAALPMGSGSSGSASKADHNALMFQHQMQQTLREQSQQHAQAQAHVQAQAQAHQLHQLQQQQHQQQQQQHQQLQQQIQQQHQMQQLQSMHQAHSNNQQQHKSRHNDNQHQHDEDDCEDDDEDCDEDDEARSIMSRHSSFAPNKMSSRPSSVNRQRLPVSAAARMVASSHGRRTSFGHQSGVGGAPTRSSSSASSNPIAAMAGMQFKLSNRYNLDGTPQLVVQLELNGVQYEGLMTPINANDHSHSVRSPMPSCESARKSAHGPSDAACQQRSSPVDVAAAVAAAAAAYARVSPAPEATATNGTGGDQQQPQHASSPMRTEAGASMTATPMVRPMSADPPHIHAGPAALSPPPSSEASDSEMPSVQQQQQLQQQRMLIGTPTMIEDLTNRVARPLLLS